MAITITWELDIDVISYDTDEVSVQATRTEIDNVELTTKTDTYSVARTKIDRAVMANNIPILDKIWEKHQTRLTANETKAAFVDGLEAAGKANLEARE